MRPTRRQERHEDFVRATRNELVAVANAMLDGRVNLLEGVRKICSLRHDSEKPDSDVFLTFRAVDSETDRFPLGELRSMYDKVKLAKLDEEMTAYVEDAKDDIFRACKNLIREFSPSDL